MHDKTFEYINIIHSNFKGTYWMPENIKIPRATLKRLPLYYRFVSTLKSKGIDRVNSKAISEAFTNRFGNDSS